MSSAPQFRPVAVAAKRSADDWREAIRLVGELYEDRGIADCEYTEAMIGAVEEFGPYMVLVPGVAMPHAKSMNGVHRSGQVVVTLASPVCFGHEANDPVDVLVSFAVGDPAVGHEGADEASGDTGVDHMDMIRSLAGVLGDADLLARVRGAADDAALANLFFNNQ